MADIKKEFSTKTIFKLDQNQHNAGGHHFWKQKPKARSVLIDGSSICLALTKTLVENEIFFRKRFTNSSTKFRKKIVKASFHRP